MFLAVDALLEGGLASCSVAETVSDSSIEKSVVEDGVGTT